MTGNEPAPFVSVVVALRNEAATIGRCLDALLNQEYPSEGYEVIVVDGRSDDGSREAVLRLISEHSRIRLVDNPHRTTPFAFNAGIRYSRGELIVVMGSHTFVEPDFLRESVLTLARTGADAAGGVLHIVGTTPFGEAVAEAVSSPFGVGNVPFRMAAGETEADTAANAVYQRKVFERVGLFDEELVRNQDDELSHRIRAAGGRIIVTPRIRSTYTARSSPGRLWRQYYAYGFFKVRVFQKHPRMMRPRHFVPGLAVAVGSAATLFAAMWPRMRLPTAGLAGFYALAVGATSLQGARRIGWGRLPHLALAYPILHLSYGSGFLTGCVRFASRWWRPEPAPPVLDGAVAERF